MPYRSIILSFTGTQTTTSCPNPGCRDITEILLKAALPELTPPTFVINHCQEKYSQTGEEQQAHCSQ